MKIFIFNNYAENTMGGGFVFAHNFKMAMSELPDVQIVENHIEADIVLIPSPTMATDKDLFDDIVNRKIPIVLRLDNMPRNSRNRGGGTSRVLRAARGASAIVYQSEWARSFLGPFLVKNGVSTRDVVILNGVNTRLFAPSGEKPNHAVVIYSRHNRDELKGWHIAWYQFIDFARAHPGAELLIIGRFSPELIEYNFDFFDGEKVTYLGSIEAREKYAGLLRNATHFLAPYDFDACSNAVLEARACGLEILTRPDPTGGLPELLDPLVDISLARMAKQYYDLFISLTK